ncbi:MAG: hypothetical protein QW733_03905 [Desulfurococcaceae archaeon]
MRGIIAIAGMMFIVGCGAIADNPQAVSKLAGGAGTLAGEAAYGNPHKGAYLGRAAGDVAYGVDKLSQQAEMSRTRVIYYSDRSYMEIVPTGKHVDNCAFVELSHYNPKGELVKKEQARECITTKRK